MEKKELSPAQSAEKASIESRLRELEKKRDKQKGDGLDPAEEDQRKRLQARDSQVKTHERAHLAAAGGLSRGGMSLVYQVGPDGRSYAIGGSVQIDTSPGKTPEETIIKAQKIRASAMAPADPSPQDIKVAAQASQMEAQARAEIAKRDSEPEPASEPVVTHSKQVVAEEEALKQAAEEREEALEEDEEGRELFMQRVARAYGG